MAVSIPGNFDNVSVPLKAFHGVTELPLSADTAVVSSDPAAATVALDMASGIVTVTRVSMSVATTTITATGGGLIANMAVNIDAAVATALVFDESAAVNS